MLRLYRFIYLPMTRLWLEMIVRLTFKAIFTAKQRWRCRKETFLAELVIADAGKVGFTRKGYS